MSDLGYDRNSADSILEFAQRLTFKSLAECVDSPLPENIRNRGDLGSLVEEYFFKYPPNSFHGPDFVEAGVELKTTGVIPTGGGKYKAKERLVLTMINYPKIVEEAWENSSLLQKCGKTLILFYLYVKEVPVTRRKFVLPALMYEFPEADLPQIKRDWEFIKEKVRAGKAHELSEGDTYYLGACRKGSGGPNEKLVSQPFSDVLAKSRAFCLKQSYVTQIVQGHEAANSVLGIDANTTFEDATKARFESFIGLTVDEISQELSYFRANSADKRFHRGLADEILLGGEVPNSEIARAGVELKTIRVDKNDRPREHMSFPRFSFADIIHEDWEDSNFFRKLESKFLFVVFKTDEAGIERLYKVFYWNMPFADREEAKKVWEETKSRLLAERETFPGAKENPVAHVRPKARNAADTETTHFGARLTKRCFWLNSSYISKVIASAK